MRPFQPISFALSCSLIAACSGSSPTGNNNGGGNGNPDGGAPPANAQCLVPTSFGDVGALSMGTAAVLPQDPNMPAGPKRILFNVAFQDPNTPTAPEDVLHFDFWQGVGAFAAGFKPATIAISGAETDFFKCSACVIVAGDFNATTGAVGKTYMATGGSMTITAIDPTPGTGKLSGSITGVTFKDVDVSGQAQVALTDGCATAVQSLKFDLTVVAGK